MVVLLLPLLAPFLVRVANAAGGITCGVNNPCPSTYPCCSEFNYCGTGSFCLGGCNPLASHSLTSCAPQPVCRDAVYTFSDNSRILSNSTYYDGNATKYDWVVEKGNIFNTNNNGGELAMTLTQANGGTRISSTHYVNHGNITARIKTGRWAGVVTAFITMSDIRDEIDWEFPGANTTQGQSNYFWQGIIPTETAGQTSSISNDSHSNYHDYTIDWQPTSLTWSIDGQVVRTVLNKGNLTDSSGVSRFPNTPSRIQLSLWPAGIPAEPNGTVQWAGGMINWSDPDYVSAGHFYALVEKVTVKCADVQVPGPNVTAYRYGTNVTANTPSIYFTNESTLINGASSISGGSMGWHGAVMAVPLGLLSASLL